MWPFLVWETYLKDRLTSVLPEKIHFLAVFTWDKSLRKNIILVPNRKMILSI